MKSPRTRFVAALFSLAVPFAGFAASFYDVAATDNIFASGRPAVVAPGGGGGGTLPVLFSLSPGAGNALQFQATGTIGQFYDYYLFGPDGWNGSSPNINAYGGISGARSTTALPLVGVFLSDATPGSPAPASLDFTPGGLGQNFLTLAPQLGQIFFIGDGQTDSSQTQTFYIPGGATRLYLGYADAFDFAGDPGYYDDNTGSLHVGITTVPEPGSLALIALGLAAISWKLKDARD